MPSRNIQSLKSSINIYEEGDINHNYYRLQTILYDLKKSIILDKWYKKKRILITNDIFMSSHIPPVKEAERYADRIGERHIKQRYLEWQAALNMMQAHPFLGVGLGNYQHNIGPYYGDLPKINTAEPNQDNGYLIIASTTGFLGLIMLTWIFIYCIQKSYHALISSEKSYNRSMSAGILGSIIGCIIVNNFSSILIAVILGYFIFVISWLFLSKE